jgi:hypothetical protein
VPVVLTAVETKSFSGNMWPQLKAVFPEIQAGAKPVTALSTMLEWQRDWAQRDTYDAVMGVVKSHLGAYGIGVEYAYTMVHGAPPTVFPEYEVPQPAVAHN